MLYLIFEVNIKVKKRIKIIGLGAGGQTKNIIDILKKEKNYEIVGLIDKIQKKRIY